ncbi:MAG: PDZ domain-containing protein [Saprospiraceae bacterium]
MKLFALTLISIFLLAARPPSARAQGGFYLPPGKRQVDVPFEYTNNFIIVTLLFNGKLPLRFIFDTGAEHTILTKREIAELLGVQYEREFRIIGSDMKTELVAYLARRVRFDLGERGLAAPREDILVLQEDYFRFEEYAGVSIHGILAASAFSKFIIKINYRRKVITLIEREDDGSWSEPGFVPLPVEFYRNKLYLNTQIAVQRDSATPVKLLIDTGAGLPLLLFTNTHALLQAPPNARPGNIGMGLGGYLDGFTGRVDRLGLGKFEQRNIVSQFQQIDTTGNLDFLNKRNGLIGNVILSRFTVVLDYQNEQIWLKPGKNYQREYDYDRSGLNLLASGRNLSRYTVQHVMPNSPASEAGLQAGDDLAQVNGIPCVLMSLPDVLKKLEGKPGKKVRLVVKRDGKRLKKTVLLRDLF